METEIGRERGRQEEGGAGLGAGHSAGGLGGAAGAVGGGWGQGLPHIYQEPQAPPLPPQQQLPEPPPQQLQQPYEPPPPPLPPPHGGATGQEREHLTPRNGRWDGRAKAGSVPGCPRGAMCVGWRAGGAIRQRQVKSSIWHAAD